MNKINFTKMHGLGNDFVVINNVDQRYTLNPSQILSMSDRHTGIGFDQLLMLEKSNKPDCDFLYRIFNADGSEVEQCGNGARCIGRYIVENKLLTKNKIKLETIKDIIEIHVDKLDSIRVNMGIPKFNPTDMPFLEDSTRANYELNVHDHIIKFQIVSMGNPHCVVQVKDINRIYINEIGRALNQHPKFPNGVNVGFMQIIDPNEIKLRVYERGVGETLACGSGACAAVVSGCRQNKLDGEVKVLLMGGELSISWGGNESPVWMRGPAVTIFDGVYSL